MWRCDPGCEPTACKPREKGGDVQVLPITNADQFTLFLKGQLDAAWAPEPWAARLVHEAGGRIFLDERDLWPNHEFVITDLIVRPKFLKEHPDVVKNFLRAHVELTDWINKNPAQAKQIHEPATAKGNREAACPGSARRRVFPDGGDLRSDSLVACQVHPAGI